MEIIVGKTAGFCYGVKRAVDGCVEQIQEKSKKIYCLGEIVHNKQVVLDLEDRGVEFIENIEDVKDIDSKVIIRAHGVEKNIYKVANNKDIELIDYTCPNVLKIHKIAEEYKNKGYYIFLTGIENHPEVIGILSNCGENVSLIKTENDMEKAYLNFKSSNIKKILLISQTTYSVKKFENIKKILEESLNEEYELVIKNTICLATETRQKETKELSLKVDIMIIIGGKNSSNTKKLYEVSLENCKNTICIETKKELENMDFKGINRVGIMAGASTPRKSIDEVVKFLNE